MVGGQAGAYEAVLKDARDLALEAMAREAEARGANAIVGVDLDYAILGSRDSMLMASANGTGVVE